MRNHPPFEPAWWLNHPHLQTIWTETMRPLVEIPVEYEKFVLRDGDTIDLAWSQTGFENTVVLLHGLGGSVFSPYMRGMIATLNKLNFNTVTIHFRGCSKEPSHSAKMFHGGLTTDVIDILEGLNSRLKSRNLFAIGFSIGGNILLKYLGEQKRDTPLTAAVAISTPFLLASTQEALSLGFSRIYQYYLLIKVKYAVIRKFMSQKDDHVDIMSIFMARNMKDFDNLFTAPMNGFRDADDYYKQASSFHYLANIEIPTLVVHAKDDPFLPADAIPKAKDLSPHVELLLTENGGHVGFVSGDSPRHAEYWLEKVVPHFFESVRR